MADGVCFGPISIQKTTDWLQVHIPRVKPVDHHQWHDVGWLQGYIQVLLWIGILQSVPAVERSFIARRRDNVRRWRWNGDAETARVVSVTRLVSTESILCTRTVRRQAHGCKSTVRAISTGRSRTLAAFGTPRPTIQAEKTPKVRSWSTPNANTECTRAPIRSGGVGFSPRPDTSTAKILQDFYKPCQRIDEDVLAVPVLCLCCWCQVPRWMWSKQALRHDNLVVIPCTEYISSIRRATTWIQTYRRLLLCTSTRKETINYVLHSTSPDPGLSRQ